MTEEVQDSLPPSESPAPAQEVPGDAKDVQGSESSTEQREDAPAQAEETPEKKVTGGFQKRIEKLVAQRHELEQRLSERERQLAMVAAQQQQQPTAAEPKPEQFEDYASFVSARAEWAAQQAVARTIAAQAAQARQYAAQQEQQRRVMEHAQRVEVARTKYADFDEVLEAAPASPVMLEYLSAIPEGPDIAYYLGRNPQEAQRIASLPERSQAIELGRVAAKVEATQRQQVSNAPSPITPVRANTAPEKSPDRMSIDEWMAARQKKLRNR